MTHVDPHIAARLADELDTEARAVFDAHVAACPACAAALERARVTWDLLGEAAGPAVRGTSVWPEVYARTFGAAGGGWLFGRGAWMKTGIAAVALAAGLAVALLVPAGRTDVEQIEAPGGGSFWLDRDTDAGLGRSWLAMATGEETP